MWEREICPLSPLVRSADLGRRFLWFTFSLSFALLIFAIAVKTFVPICAIFLVASRRGGALGRGRGDWGGAGRVQVDPPVGWGPFSLINKAFVSDKHRNLVVREVGLLLPLPSIPHARDPSVAGLW